MITKDQIVQYKKEQEDELESILFYWMHYTIDKEHGGFYGRIDHDNNIDSQAAKGSVLNSRILWSFSAAFKHTGNPEYLVVAERAFTYILEHFIDKNYGGVYWSVDYKGKVLDTKKQIYASAFALYGMSEYYQASKNEVAKKSAIDLYHAIENYSHDRRNKGYIEALSSDWKELDDLRLSAKDANERKSMNTHLHVLEAYTNLYRIWPEGQLKRNIEELIHLFLEHIIDKQTNHLVLFFDDDWNQRSSDISFGHDIEAAWLVQEAAEMIGNANLLQQVKTRSIQVARAAAEGLDKDGGLWYEVEEGQLKKEKHWWPQAEAMVGFLNAWQISKEEQFFHYSWQTWQFVKQHILQKEKGEWKWGIKADYSAMQGEDKVGIWKCPYHNSRSCLELSRRLQYFV